MKPYFVAYFGTMLATLSVMPVVIWCSARLGLVDNPHARKIHTRAIPRVGGTGIFLSVSFFVLAAIWFTANVVHAPQEVVTKPVTALLWTSALVFLTGLVDDVKNLSGQVKFVVLVLASLAVCNSGATISRLSVGELVTLDLGHLSWPVTVLWIVGVTVGINFIDGVDGLAGGLSAIVCGVIALTSWYFGQVFLAMIMVAMVGALSGFLIHNWHPAETFMGDCGSMFLGFTIGAATVVCASQSGTVIGLALPALALGVPIIDSASTIVRRGVLERRSIFKAERGHIHHRLLDLGLSQRHVVIVLYAVTIVASLMGSVMLLTGGIAAVVVFVCTATLLFLFFHVVGSVRFKETVTAIRNHMELKREIGKYKDSFEETQLHIRVAQSFDQWWSALCKAAEHMNFAWISVRLTASNGDAHTSVWRPEKAVSMSNLAIMKIPLPDQGPSVSIDFEIAIPIDSTLESASQRATLFSRLLDETELPVLLTDGLASSTFSLDCLGGIR